MGEEKEEEDKENKEDEEERTLHIHVLHTCADKC